MDDLIKFQQQRIEALELELKRTKAVLEEISSVSTDKARDIKVILSDPNFNKPLKNLEKTYKL